MCLHGELSLTLEESGVRLHESVRLNVLDGNTTHFVGIGEEIVGRERERRGVRGLTVVAANCPCRDAQFALTVARLGRMVGPALVDGWDIVRWLPRLY